MQSLAHREAIGLHLARGASGRYEVSHDEYLRNRGGQTLIFCRIMFARKEVSGV